MIRAEVLTQWAGQGTEASPNVPSIIEDYVIREYRDATDQSMAAGRPDPNQFVVYIECESAVLAQIETDPLYFILWSEEILVEVSP